MLLRSFLTVGSGFVLSFMSAGSILVVLGYAFFPEYIEFLNLDIQIQETMMETNPEAAIPPTMFWSMVALNSIACLAIGWLVIRTAPFAPLPHAVFLAVVMFITYLQLVIEQPQKQKSMTIVFMIAFPIAILIGAKLAIGGVPLDDDDSTTSSSGTD